MTFGRPSNIPNEYMKLDLPLNQNLERLTMMTNSTVSVGSMDTPDTVCFFISTMYDLVTVVP